MAIKVDIGLLYEVEEGAIWLDDADSFSSVKKASSFRPLDLFLEWGTNPPVAGPLPA